MKKYIILILIICGSNHVNAQKTISIVAEGNLESPNPLGCVNLSDVTSKNNPADILNGMGKCIELGEYEKAAKLFAIAGVYGTYDTYRVKDKTAHQALLVLQRNLFSSFDENQTDLLLQYLEKQLESNSENLSEICLQIKEIGQPEYYPRYMIQHGISAFTNNNGDGLVKRFKSKKSWGLALSTYLKCEE